MTRASISLPQAAPQPRARPFLETSRHDGWWVMPAITLVYFLSFVVYSTWAAFQGEHYYFAGSPSQIAEGGWHSQYLSPMYSPVLWVDSSREGAAPLHHAWLGEWPDWLPKLLFGFIPITPALFILWAPGGFRFTCYYYRGAYYKAFWGDPVNCAVGEPSWRGENYRGERWAPLTLQNIHRWFMYIAVIFIFILSYDAIISYIFVQTDATGHVTARKFGVGVGSLIITANAFLLAMYTFGCHSLRHVVGGKNDCVSASPARYKAWKCVTCLNGWHMQWAWISLFWVGFTDIYIRLCSMGIWSDWRII
jgi:hypothetical protein